MSEKTTGRLLDNGIAIITGGAQGLGQGIAQCMAAQGARLFLLDVDEERAQSAARNLPGEGHRGFRCDITSEPERRAALSGVLSEASRIDVLVNNAGIQYHSAAEDLDEAKWRRLFDVNLFAMMFTSREVGRVMLTQRSGSIINIASIAALTGMPRRIAYVTAKTAVIGLTRSLAVEWASRGVRVNAVCPGYFRTPLLEEYIEKGAVDPEKIRKRIPMGRMGNIEELANAVVFFASSYSSYITGQYLSVDGGYTSFGAPEEACQ